MSYDTKIRKNAGSMITVIPNGIIRLMEMKSGDKITWDVDITKEGATIKVIPHKE